MEEESKPYCHKFNRSQPNRLPVDCLKDSGGNLAATPAVARGRLTRMSNRTTAHLSADVFFSSPIGGFHHVAGRRAR